MEKISGILPATARITTVDLRNSGTARSGAPSYGRDVGVSATAEKLEAQRTAVKANFEHKNQMNIRDQESDPKSAIVQRMADNFFLNKAKQQEEDVRFANEDKDVGAVDFEKEFNPKSAGALTAKSNNETGETDSDDDNLAVGQYLDVQA